MIFLSPQCTSMCFLNACTSLNLRLQVSQTNGRTELWVIVWVLNPDEWVNCFPHIWQTCLSTECFDMCTFRLVVEVLGAPQIPQFNKPSPVCSFLCRFILYRLLNSLSQTGQLIALPKCTTMWFLRVDDWVNDLPQISQLYGFSPVWVLRWGLRLTKYSLQMGHCNDLSLLSAALWFLICPRNVVTCLNSLPQISQQNWFVSACKEWCCLSDEGWANWRLHVGHW